MKYLSIAIVFFLFFTTYARAESNINSILDLAMNSYMEANYQLAIQSFEAAIETNLLNSEGRAVCYWYIAESYKELGLIKEATEAYFFFTIVAYSILKPTDWEHNPIPPNKEFIEGFKIDLKFSYAISFINMIWRSRVHEKDI